MKKFLLIFFMFFALFFNINIFGYNSIILNKKNESINYIDNIYISIKKSNLDKIFYSLEYNKYTPFTLKLAKHSFLTNSYVYILNNGYPNKNITNDALKDNYITQLSIWWFHDRINGINDNQNGYLTSKLKQYDNEIVNCSRDLVENAYSNYVKNNASPILNIKKTTDFINVDSNLEGIFKLNSNIDISSYNITLYNGYVTDLNNNRKDTFNIDDSFKIIIPNNITNFNVNIKATNPTFGIYSYSHNELFQELLSTDIIKKNNIINVNKNIKVNDIEVLNEINSKLLIKTTDINNNKIKGCKLILMDANKNVIKEITTSNKDTIIDNLSSGIYYLTEISVPKNYILNNEVNSFKIDNDEISIKIFNEQNLSNVKIGKIKNRNYIKGSTLAIKDSEDNIIDTIISEDKAINVSLPFGSYSLTEIKANDGYVINSTPINFLVNQDGGKSNLVTINDDLILKVPNTVANASILVIICGCLIILIGFTLVYTNVKKKK